MTDSEAQDPRAVRDRAIELLQRRGWARRGRDEYGGPDRCRLGIVRALWMADEELDGWLPSRRPGSAGDRARAEIEHELGIRDLFVWNSRPGRTADQVLAALRGPRRTPVSEDNCDDSSTRAAGEDLVPCPVGECRRRIARDVAMCRPHWHRVPRKLREEVWRRWQHRLDALERGVAYEGAAALHEAAKAAAIRAAEEAESR